MESHAPLYLKKGSENMGTFNDLVPICIVLGVVWGVFQYVILRPLNSAIESLHEAVKELRKEIRAGEERRHDMELKLTEVEQSTKSAHHRLDTLEKEIKE